jgi:cyclophilin family peptidyl-prolyl cis-trans isomerase
MRWFPRRVVRPSRKSVRQPALRLMPLEGREVPAVLPQFWFLSSTWAGARVGPAAPPADDGGSEAPPPVPGGSPPTTPTIALAAASDTGTQGDRITASPTVTLTGSTTPNAAVRLVQTGKVVRAGAFGEFTFTGVPLTAGVNNLTVRAQTSGGRSTGTIAITREAAPTVKATLAPVALAAGGTTSVDLAGTFDDADLTNTRVRFDTSAGPVNVELFDRAAPKTVTNFLNYVGDGDYTDSIFHRSAKLTGGTPFVLQGGGFTFEAGTPPTIAAVPQDPPVQNEPDAATRSNLRGTIAMAKLGGQQDSATNQFFFNLGNNAAILDGQNGGFTVFGKVVGAADQAVVDQLAAIPTQNQGQAPDLPASQQGVFTEIPLTGYTGTDFPSDATRSNFAIINGATVTQPSGEELTYSIVSNSNPAAATATITDNRLAVQGVAAGTTTLTIRATDQTGNTVQTTVTVTVT